MEPSLPPAMAEVQGLEDLEKICKSTPRMYGPCDLTCEKRTMFSARSAQQKETNGKGCGTVSLLIIYTLYFFEHLT